MGDMYENLSVGDLTAFCLMWPLLVVDAPTDILSVIDLLRRLEGGKSVSICGEIGRLRDNSILIELSLP